MLKTVVIDCFPDSARRYSEAYAIVAVDVIRATTTAITAVHLGRRCFPVPSIEAALPLAARLRDPLLVGELGGNMPYGFHMTNSPAHISARDYDAARPLILVSSSGTQLIHNARNAPACYLACFRNLGATVEHLATRHRRVALIGAGTRGEFREEDQMCCAWIARGLLEHGYTAQNERTRELVERWKDEPVEACARSNSAAYLRDTGQHDDLEFILSHVDDLTCAYELRDEEVVRVALREPESASGVG